MPGRSKLRRIQFGFEPTPGTAVAATTRWRGPAVTLDDDRQWEFVEEDVGIVGGTGRKVLPYAQGNLKLPATPLTPEQFPILMALALGGPITGATDGSGSSGFRYVTTLPTTSGPAANRAATVETGDDYEVENAAYTKVLDWTIKGTQKKPITVEATLQSQQVGRLGTGFSATTLATLNDLLFWNTRLYLDAVGGTIGTTQITNQFLGCEISGKTTYAFKQTGEGPAAGTVPTYNLVVYTDHEIRVKLTLEHDPAVDGNTGIKSLFRAGTPRLMRLDCLGQAYATAGTGTLLTGRRGVRFDLPLDFIKIPGLDAIEGNDIVTVEAVSRYNTTYGSSGAITVCNEVTAL